MIKKITTIQVINPVAKEAWKKKYPNVAEKISNLDHRLKTLEQLAILTKDDGK